MDVTEFAEQIVFGTSLEEKLQRPGKLTFGTSVSVDVQRLVTPGRPNGLQMSMDPGVNAQPPSDHQLENEKSRGQLLHFLANHELLATELMALVLLKFPDAPKAFRQGVLVTLQEEQEHTRMYLQRMKECGVEFGSFPLSGQFWRVVEPMQTPMDFVSRLSLTFEQANLDYSQHFSKVFQRIGDLPTSQLLHKIYEDEIGHVKHGLEWFRQWKNPDQDDWDAYQQALSFPMSPQRGRGTRCVFNREGRIKAGLSEHFIDAIEVFRQSRGRAPTIRWFDPGAEAELAGELSAQERKLLDQLGKDLELVLVPMSKQDDIVLIREPVSREQLKHLIEAGFDLPEFALFSEQEKLIERKLHDFSPWAWTHANVRRISPLVASVKHRPPEWCLESPELYRKSWAMQRLSDWLDDAPNGFVSSECLGRVVNDVGEVKDGLREFASRGYSTAIFKLDLAASGRGQRRLRCDQPLAEEDVAWLNSVFRTESVGVSDESDSAIAIIEPELNRLVDLSFLWDASDANGEFKFQGWTRSLVTAGRRYAGTRLGMPFADCDEPIKRFLLADRCRRLHEVGAWLAEKLIPDLTDRGFQGFLGVDAFVFQDGQENLAMKPLVELNPRMTMGHVAHQLEKRLAPGVLAEFRVFTRSERDRFAPKLDFAGVVKSNDGYLKSGVVWLGEVRNETKLVPALIIGRQLVESLHDEN